MQVFLNYSFGEFAEVLSAPFYNECFMEMKWLKEWKDYKNEISTYIDVCVYCLKI